MWYSIVSLLLLTAFGLSEAAKHLCSVVNVVANTNEYKLTTQKDDCFNVRMEGNPTTGYAWQLLNSVSDTTSGVVEDGCPKNEECDLIWLSEQSYEAGPNPNHLVGVGGLYIFRFKTLGETGQQKLTFRYSRSWDVKPTDRTVDVTVNVTAPRITGEAEA